MENENEEKITRFCPRCGTPVMENSYFCVKCGTPLKENDEQENNNICPKCGNELKDNMPYCPKCYTPNNNYGRNYQGSSAPYYGKKANALNEDGAVSKTFMTCAFSLYANIILIGCIFSLIMSIICICNTVKNYQTAALSKTQFKRDLIVSIGTLLISLVFCTYYIITVIQNFPALLEEASNATK